MKANRVLLVSFVLVCLVLAIAVSLSAQSVPLIGQRVPPPSPVPKQATPRPTQSLERRCREFLVERVHRSAVMPDKDQFQYVKLPDRTYREFRADASDDAILAQVLKDFPDANNPMVEWWGKLWADQWGARLRGSRAWWASSDGLRARIEAAEDDELASAVKRARECVNLPNARVRLAAFDAYGLLLDEQYTRSFRYIDTFWGKQMADWEEERKKQNEEIAKQRADFAETAAYAATLYKQNEQYRQGAIKLVVDYVELQDRYRDAYNLAHEAINLAQEVRRTSLSLPVFVNTPAPQVIRVEAPAVPRSLDCTSRTMPSIPGATTWTWTDCHW